MTLRAVDLSPLCRSGPGLLAAGFPALASAVPAAASASRWEAAWPRTDFSLHSVPLDEIVSGGPGKDGIPSIDAPGFVSVAEMQARGALAPREPVIGFAARHAEGKVLVPSGDVRRPYGINPYRGYDSARRPFLFDGDYPEDIAPEDIAPMTRVVAVGTQAWSLPLLREKGRIEAGDLVLTWEPGQTSALDAETIARGREVGNVVVRRRTGSGLADVPYDVTFAFVFYAFQPEGTWHLK